MPLAPTPIRQLSAEDAAHLLRRTSFGATDAEIRTLVGQSPQDAVGQLLSFPQTTRTDSPFKPLDAVNAAAALKLVQGEWVWEMLYTPYPLRERLALVWSNHFVVGLDKVRNAPSLSQYVSLLRAHSLGDFTLFATEVAKSPAMLRYLDNDQNRKGSPNENFSRELLELFTTGIGHYSEQDVHEGARGLTGWTFTGGRGNNNFADQPTFSFNIRQHDGAPKTYLGQTGTFMPEDIVRIASTQPATADFVSAKLWKAFVSSVPGTQGAQGQAQLAETFRSTGGDLRAVMTSLLTSDAFYAASNRASLFRSPLEYVVGAARSMGSPAMDPKTVLSLTGLCARMGQDLLHPATVKGWDGGRSWINDGTLLLRMQAAAALTLGGNAPKPLAALTPLSLLGQERGSLDASLKLLPEKQRGYLMLISPEYQLI